MTKQALEGNARQRLARPTVASQIALGRGLLREGQVIAAGAAFRSALDADPRRPDLLSMLGICLRRSGDNEAAAEAFQQALRLAPGDPDLHVNLGNARLDGDRFGEACASYREALRILPTHAVAAVNLARALRRRGELAAAVAAYRELLARQPGMGDAWIELANTLEVLGETAPALAAAREGRRLLPGDPRAWLVEGNALMACGDFATAHDAFLGALALDARSGDALRELASCQRSLGRLAAAETTARRALALDPASPDAALSVAYSLLHQGRADEALPVCDALLAESPRNAAAHHLRCVLSCYAGDPDPALARRSEALFAAPSGAASPARAASPAPRRRIAVGFVSADFRQHSVAYFLLPLLEQLDRGGFSISLYFAGGARDAFSERFRPLADRWAEVARESDELLAQRIRADGVDVLIDLSGHTAGNRLGVFARRAAPVQATWLGYPTVTGLAQMDYRLTDRAVDPAGSEHGNSERPVRLPASYFCYGGPGIEPEVGELPALGNGHVTFGSFNNLAKLTPAAMQLWVRVLRAVPGSRLKLKSDAFLDPASADAIAGRFEALGLSRERLDLLAWESTTEAHLRAYGGVDIALDSFPYNGATTTCEALWMGVPVVSLAGATHASRMGRSILRAAGLGPLVAENQDDFVATVVRLAGDPAQLALLRGGLRPRLRRSALMDAERFAADFAAAVETMVAGKA